MKVETLLFIGHLDYLPPGPMPKRSQRDYARDLAKSTQPSAYRKTRRAMHIMQRNKKMPADFSTGTVLRTGRGFQSMSHEAGSIAQGVAEDWVLATDIGVFDFDPTWPVVVQDTVKPVLDAIRASLTVK